MGQDPRLVVPYVTEQSPRGERTMDVYSRLLNDRIVFLGTPVDDAVANAIIAQLLHLDSEDPERDINLYINSPGGSVTAGLAVYDTMRFINADVATTALGMAASISAVLLAAGEKGKRNALPNTRVLLHQPWTQGGPGGRRRTWRYTPGSSYAPSGGSTRSWRRRRGRATRRSSATPTATT